MMKDCMQRIEKIFAYSHQAETGPEVIKLFSCSTQLSMKFYMLISIKISRNSAFFQAQIGLECYFWNFNIYELEKIQAQKKIYNLGIKTWDH